MTCRHDPYLPYFWVFLIVRRAEMATSATATQHSFFILVILASLALSRISLVTCSEQSRENLGSGSSDDADHLLELQPALAFVLRLGRDIRFGSNNRVNNHTYVTGFVWVLCIHDWHWWKSHGKRSFVGLKQRTSWRNCSCLLLPRRFLQSSGQLHPRWRHAQLWGAWWK